MEKKSFMKIFSFTKLTRNEHHYISHNLLQCLLVFRGMRKFVFDVNLNVMSLSMNRTGNKVLWPIVPGKRSSIVSKADIILKNRSIYSAILPNSRICFNGRSFSSGS